MNLPLLFGGMALGIAIACLVAFFLNRFDVFNTKVLGAVVSIIAGAVVTTFLGWGKQDAWVGYCVGLGGLLLFFVFVGYLSIRHEVPQKISGRMDARLQMLDELKKRYSDGAISYGQYEDMKAPILAEIKKNPFIAENSDTKTR